MEYFGLVVDSSMNHKHKKGILNPYQLQESAKLSVVLHYIGHINKPEAILKYQD
jgi:hypothetical protein